MCNNFQWPEQHIICIIQTLTGFWCSHSGSLMKITFRTSLIYFKFIQSWLLGKVTELSHTVIHLHSIFCMHKHNPHNTNKSSQSSRNSLTGCQDDINSDCNPSAQWILKLSTIPSTHLDPIIKVSLKDTNWISAGICNWVLAFNDALWSCSGWRIDIHQTSLRQIGLPCAPQYLN